MRGILLQNSTLVDREGSVHLLIKQHTEETELDFDEEAMYEPLVELARGKNIGTLAIKSDNGELKYIVNMVYEWWGS